MEKFIKLKLYILTLILLNVSCITDCGDGTSCEDLETCCPMDRHRFGCCPFEDAVCCEDKLHCCPNGYKCDLAKGKCRGNTFFWETELKEIRTSKNIVFNPEVKENNQSIKVKFLDCVNSLSSTDQEKLRLIKESKGDIKSIISDLNIRGDKLYIRCIDIIDPIK